MIDKERQVQELQDALNVVIDADAGGETRWLRSYVRQLTKSNEEFAAQIVYMRNVSKLVNENAALAQEVARWALRARRAEERLQRMLKRKK